MTRRRTDHWIQENESSARLAGLWVQAPRHASGQQRRGPRVLESSPRGESVREGRDRGRGLSAARSPFGGGLQERRRFEEQLSKRRGHPSGHSSAMRSTRSSARTLSGRSSLKTSGDGLPCFDFDAWTSPDHVDPAPAVVVRAPNPLQSAFEVGVKPIALLRSSTLPQHRLVVDSRDGAVFGVSSEGPSDLGYRSEPRRDRADHMCGHDAAIDRRCDATRHPPHHSQGKFIGLPDIH